MKKTFFTSVILLWLITCFSQENFPQGMIGTWIGNGKLSGNDASFSITWQKALNEKFIKLTFRNQYQVNGKNYVMDAEAYYKRSTDTSLSGTWFDSRGQILQLSAVLTANTMSVEWGAIESQKGKTIYDMKSENEMEVKDYIYRNGQWQLFGQAAYKRK